MTDKTAEGMIFDIQHFSLSDGEGIRTTVFFKGCPLRCNWCHNPEGLEMKQELIYSAEKCTYCGVCARVCPAGVHAFTNDGRKNLHRKDCRSCGICEAACTYGALRLVGKRMKTQEVIDEVLCDSDFYKQSGGGITLSGGEPFFQPDFALSILSLAKQSGLNTYVETCGYCESDIIMRAAHITDTFLFDIKETDSVRHKQFTGVSNEKIIKNLRCIEGAGADIILRCPIIPGCNLRTEHAYAIAGLANESKQVRQVHIEPYHPIGLSKYTNLDKVPVYACSAFCDKKDLYAFAEAVQSRTDVRVLVSE